MDDMKMLLAGVGGLSPMIFSFSNFITLATSVGCCIYIWIRVWKTWKNRNDNNTRNDD